MTYLARVPHAGERLASLPPEYVHRMDPLDTRMSIGHSTCPVDPMDEWDVHCTNGMSNG